MKFTALKTPYITAGNSLIDIIAGALPQIPEKSILVITSKVVSIVEKACVPLHTTPLRDLIQKESETPPLPTAYQNVWLTQKYGRTLLNAGIDTSNIENQYILLPQDPFKSVGDIRDALLKKYQLSDLGVLMIDSRTMTQVKGISGVTIAWSGFTPLASQIGHADLVGQRMQSTIINIAEPLAAAATLTMGECDESQPLCLVENIPHVRFTNQRPTPAEISAYFIDPSEDIYTIQTVPSD